jgi:hypothetical protein
VLSSVNMRITSSDPANIECVVSGDGLRVTVNAQALSHAWTQFDTLSAHFAQAFAGSVHGASSQPTDLAGLGYAAFWIAAENTLYATNGSQSQGGSYVTVNVTGNGSQASKLRLAETLATATLAAAPRGPSPGPAPS